LTRTLLIFARAPHLGAAKRRLARDIGAVAAQRFYIHTMSSIVRRLSCDPRWRTVLAVTGGATRWPGGVTRMQQPAGSLGRRMDRAIRGMPPGPVVLVGTDIPDLAPRHIAAAFDALGEHDAVFGPATDGGYWLVGLRRRPFQPRLDGPVRWSTEHALADTIANFDPRVRVTMVETLADIDDGEDLARWRAGSGR
jgi:rSAM/selenodomain-associated transferase 1